MACCQLWVTEHSAGEQCGRAFLRIRLTMLGGFQQKPRTFCRDVGAAVAREQAPAECRHGVPVTGPGGTREGLNRLRMAPRRIKLSATANSRRLMTGMLLARTRVASRKTPGDLRPRACLLSYCGVR